MKEPADADILDYDEEGGFGNWLVTLLRICAVAFLVILFIWSSLVRPFRIPSGSMVPTLEVGDHIAVPMLTYGLNVPWLETRGRGFLGLPVGTKEVFSWGEPARGDVVVFKYPPDPSIDFVKRIVGLPGDTIELRDNVLYVNGEPAPRTYVEEFTFVDDACRSIPASLYTEALGGVSHAVLDSGGRHLADRAAVTVPEGQYFVMGDNRDNSADSRIWGTVPRGHIVGKAYLIWLSWDTCQGDIPQLGSFRSGRFARRIE